MYRRKVERCRHVGVAATTRMQGDSLRSLICKIKLHTFVGDGESLIIKLKIRKPVPAHRWPAFAGSTMLHCASIAMMTVCSVRPPIYVVTRTITPKYSVRFIHLQTPSEYLTHDASHPAQETGKSAKLERSKGTSGRRSPGKSGPVAPLEPSIAREHRHFQLPPDIRKQPVTQTLVQMDLPPDLLLKQEIPLPTALLWNQTLPPPPTTRQFVAPPAEKTPAIAQSLPAAPVLMAPNRETDVANVNVAAAPVNDTPHLTHRATIASPVSNPGQEPAKTIPQIGLATSDQPSAANLIALSNTPLHSTPIVVLPPANQIAASDRANAGSTAGDGGPGNAPPASGASGHAISSQSAEELAAIQAKKNAAKASEANSKAPDNAKGNAAVTRESASTSKGETPSPKNAVVAAGPSGKSAGEPTGTKVAPPEAAPVPSIPGATRITQPKDGKFAVVVLGSAASSRYPESAGALSGKVVYSVYLRVGLRKNWILQYCLPKAVGQGSVIPVDAPWPFEMMRPDRWGSSDSDYIIVKGMLTSGGRFEQLAMVFPDDFETKDLLLTSLKGWAFRPASRDGEPTAVEVLLIIPRETE